MNSSEISSEPEEIKLPCPNIVVNELDNPSIVISNLASFQKKSRREQLFDKMSDFWRKVKQLHLNWCGKIKSLVLIISKHALSIYFFFNTILLLALISKTIIYPKVVYYWIGSSFLLFLLKIAEYLQNYRYSSMRSFEMLDQLENQLRLSRTRSVLRQAAVNNPFLGTLLRNEQQLMRVLNVNENNNFGRFSEYNTVFNNLLRLRVHVLAMRMNMMMHALVGFSDEENSNGSPENNNRGLTQGEIDEMEVTTYKSEGKEAPECTICLETVAEGEEIKVLDCGHSFHRGCIDKWLLLQRLCPYCRTSV